MNDHRPVTPEELVARVAQIEIAAPPGARQRVWTAVQAEAARRRGAFPWRLAMPIFFAGAATAALIAFWSIPKSDRALVMLPDGAQRAVAVGQPLPSAHEPAIVELLGVGRGVAGPDTRATLQRFDGRGVELSVERGSLLVHVLPRDPRAPFVVRTPGFSARVVGTVLRVAVGVDGASSIAVGHGAVEVTPVGGAPLMVKTGERWPASSRELPSAVEFERLGTADLEGATFEEDPIRAESELYQAGWTRLRESHDPAGALSIWEQQRARFPHGVLVEEARASIIDALVALRENARARAEIEAYFRAAPDGLRTGEMHFVLGTLFREADHDCRRAAVEFDRALDRAAEPWASRARAARDGCRR